tara:strand:- start:32 stop:604 length:573 start_codon:yes stop_codon:yes gene_type:complete
MSKIIVNQIESSDGTTDVLNSLSAVNVAGAGMGQVLQVASTFSNTHASVASVTLTDTGVSVSITPSSTSSKIFLTVDAFMGSSNTDSNGGLAIYRSAPGGSAGYVGVGDNGSNNNQTQVGGAVYVKDSKGQNVGLSFLDTPNTTDQCTYKLYFNSRSGSYTTYLNRTHSNSNNNYMYVGGTTITAMEIAG